MIPQSPEMIDLLLQLFQKPQNFLRRHGLRLAIWLFPNTSPTLTQEVPPFGGGKGIVCALEKRLRRIQQNLAVWEDVFWLDISKLVSYLKATYMAWCIMSSYFSRTKSWNPSPSNGRPEWQISSPGFNMSLPFRSNTAWLKHEQNDEYNKVIVACCIL